mgnify:CR=1 FL=1
MCGLWISESRLAVKDVTPELEMCGTDVVARRLHEQAGGRFVRHRLQSP